MNGFRKDLTRYTYTLKEVQDIDSGFKDSDNFIPEDEVKSTLDSIEDDINTIKDMLEGISGLSEIDDIYKIVKELSDRLY